MPLDGIPEITEEEIRRESDFRNQIVEQLDNINKIIPEKYGGLHRILLLSMSSILLQIEWPISDAMEKAMTLFIQMAKEQQEGYPIKSYNGAFGTC